MPVNEVVDLIGRGRILRHEPGNMTTYLIVAILYREDEWIVALPEYGASMFVSSGMTLAPGYVAEKLRRRTGEFQGGDIDAIIAGIHKMLPETQTMD